MHITAFYLCHSLLGFTHLISTTFSLSAANFPNRRSTIKDITSSILLVSTQTTTTTTNPSYASNINTPTNVESSQYLNPPNAPNIKVPRVGYSYYKTDVSQIESCTYLALAAGIRHLDVASMYGTNQAIGSILNTYISSGYIPSINQTSYRPIIMMESQQQEQQQEDTLKSQPIIKTKSYSTVAFLPMTEEEEQKKRRQDLFISHKLSNTQQSTNPNQVRQAILDSIKDLQISYLDMVSIHSPLTDKNKRLTTYQELVRIQQEEQQIIGCIGVCNYGVGPLEEIIQAGLPPPAVIQLELSPFNQHKDVIAWGKKHGCIFSCAAWSKLSSIDGPQNEWAILASIAKKYGITKAQVLIRWALQKGYVCVPRSSVGSKVERKAIFENSFHGIEKFQLSSLDMETLDGLDVNLKAGKLGRRDGWEDSDVKDVNWDPTLSK